MHIMGKNDGYRHQITKEKKKKKTKQNLFGHSHFINKVKVTYNSQSLILVLVCHILFLFLKKSGFICYSRDDTLLPYYRVTELDNMAFR